MDNISYLIVTYNGENHIKTCINCIRKFDKDGFILVIDNASNDNTINIANTSFPSKVIKLNKNLGFGKANNIGLKYLYNKGFKYFYLVNQDLYFKYGDYSFFTKKLETFTKKNYVIISPLHLAPNSKDFDFKFKTYISEKNTPNLLKDLKKDEVLDVYDSKVVNAAAWVLSRKTIEEVGYFDPLFDHYGEDTDYINRVKHYGLKIGVSPIFKVIHNRPQLESILPNKMSKRSQIWALTYLKDINYSLLRLTALFPLVLLQRFKNNNLKWRFYFVILLFVYSKLYVIAKSRKESKNKFAYVNSIQEYG